jgi:hypothetical protein
MFRRDIRHWQIPLISHVDELLESLWERLTPGWKSSISNKSE